MRRLVLAALLLTACSGDDGDGAATRPPPPPPAYLVDAAPAPAPAPAPADADAGALPRFDPASGYHLDEDLDATAPQRADRRMPRERRWLQLMLKSTPSGAIAAVDGKVVGRTPVYWEGEFTGREREFTFVLPGYSMARYRFVPTQDGFVHGRLIKVADEGDGGVPAIPEPLPEAPPPEVPSRPARRPAPTPVPAPAPAPVTSPSDLPATAPDAAPVMAPIPDASPI